MTDKGKWETDIPTIKKMKNNTGTFSLWDDKKGIAVVYTKPSKSAEKYGYPVISYLIDFTTVSIKTFIGDCLTQKSYVLREALFSQTYGTSTIVTKEQDELFKNKLSTLLKKAIIYKSKEIYAKGGNTNTYNYSIGGL